MTAVLRDRLYCRLLAAFLLLQLLDAATTYVGLRFAVVREVNPLFLRFFAAGDPAIGCLVRAAFGVAITLGFLGGGYIATSSDDKLIRHIFVASLSVAVVGFLAVIANNGAVLLHYLK